jgi:DNA-binding GntR family transcriptional regulator
MSYRQDFPFDGLIANETTTAGQLTLKAVTNAYGLAALGGTRQRVFLGGSTVQRTDLNGAALPSVTTAYQYDGFYNRASEHPSGYVVEEKRDCWSGCDPAGHFGFRRARSVSWEAIYAEVEREIVARISFASWRVNEAELSRAYKVSRTVARDVVGRLQQRGVVRKDESSRWYAPGLKPEHAGELYEMRWLREPVALVKAAPHVAPAFLAQMRQDLEYATANAHNTGGATLDQRETSMHVTLLAHCGNHTLMQAITLPQSLLIANSFRYRWTPLLFDTEPFLPEHLDIVYRLERGDAKKAAGALEHHLRVSSDRAIARIAAVTQEFRPDELPYLERITST